MNIDDLINSFAAKLKAAGVPIQPEDNALMLGRLEQALPKRLPQSLEHFLSRYSFPRFDVCRVTLFGWSSGLEVNDYFDVASAKDGSLSELLLPGGYFQIGRPDTGGFDAVCLNLNVKEAEHREYPLVVADHEEILCNNRVKISRQIWPSFLTLITTAVESHNASIYYEEPFE